MRSGTKKQGLILAAPHSGSGKTVVTLALLRAFKQAGVDICAAKAGPDYIDPGFHQLACGQPSVNLDPWAMNEARLRALAGAQQGSHLLVEAMMGLFDGAADGSGSAAELAKTLQLPVVLVVDAAKQSHSIAALVRGFRDHDAGVRLAGVILNRVGSSRHEVMLRSALAAIAIPVFGAIPRDTDFALPERHLGLVQAGEMPDIENFIVRAAKRIAECCDLEGLLAAFGGELSLGEDRQPLPPLAQRVAIARDEAFSFIYPHLLEDWHSQGAQLSFFSPLGDEAPAADCDGVYLPGGYPELHGPKLSGAKIFHQGLVEARDRGALIFGECGGYMVLGQGLVDSQGKRHPMAGLLQLETSFEKRQLHLGYRKLSVSDFPLGNRLAAHEFHYTRATREEGSPLFQVVDAMGEALGGAGLREGRVMGSYMHIIDRAE